MDIHPSPHVMCVLRALTSKHSSFILEGPVHANCIAFQSDQTPDKNSGWEEEVVWSHTLKQHAHHSGESRVGFLVVGARGWSSSPLGGPGRR